jgi:hypothetical protein
MHSPARIVDGGVYVCRFFKYAYEVMDEEERDIFRQLENAQESR